MGVTRPPFCVVSVQAGTVSRGPQARSLWGANLVTKLRSCFGRGHINKKNAMREAMQCNTTFVVSCSSGTQREQATGRDW